MNILSMQTLKRLRVPVPPVETQQAIVAEIEAEQVLVSANLEAGGADGAAYPRRHRRVWEG